MPREVLAQASRPASAGLPRAAPEPAHVWLHATCVQLGGVGVVLLGASGVGKSDLALRLIDAGAAAGRRRPARGRGRRLPVCSAGRPSAWRACSRCAASASCACRTAGSARSGLVVELDRADAGAPAARAVDLPDPGHRAAPSAARSAPGLGRRQGPARALRRAGRLSRHAAHRPGHRHGGRRPHDRAPRARGRRLRGGRQPADRPARQSAAAERRDPPSTSRSASTVARMPSIRRG